MNVPAKARWVLSSYLLLRAWSVITGGRIESDSRARRSPALGTSAQIRSREAQIRYGAWRTRCLMLDFRGSVGVRSGDAYGGIKPILMRP
jgi:hypothetical protein